MVHPALFRASLVSGFSFERVPTYAPAWKPLEPAKRALRSLNAWMASGYRPELHYMRGGRTFGAKSLSAR